MRSSERSTGTRCVPNENGNIGVPPYLYDTEQKRKENWQREGKFDKGLAKLFMMRLETGRAASGEAGPCEPLRCIGRLHFTRPEWPIW
jgi:hypothetical protein